MYACIPIYQESGTHLCSVLQFSSMVKIEVKGQLEMSFEVNSQAIILGVGQGQSKILAKMSAVIGSMQCSNKKIGQNFDCGQRLEYTAYASATPSFM